MTEFNKNILKRNVKKHQTYLFQLKWKSYGS